jgi:hypothetical protein
MNISTLFLLYLDNIDKLGIYLDNIDNYIIKRNIRIPIFRKRGYP